ncbi:MAG: PAS domain S-box protein [Planctomycetes bacterium]|nr:PAS domain S-box protein [Planctomycetota bacterium]
MTAPTPLETEQARLEALRRFEILDTPPERAFEEIVKLAARLCRVPIAYIAFLDEARQWIKAKIGIELQSSPRRESFCHHTIQSPGLTFVPDALADDRFRESPLVRAGPQIRFYAGAPLVTAEGCAVGTLCVADSQPRDLSHEEQDSLRSLAGIVVRELELREAATSRRRIAEAYRKIYHAVQHSPAIVMVTDLTGIIEHVNPKFTEVTGYPSGEVLGRPATGLGEQSPDDARRMWEVLSRGGTWSGEFLNRRKDGVAYWEAASISTLHDESGRATHYIKIAEDVTVRREAQEALRMMNAQLERTVRERTLTLLQVSRNREDILNSAGEGIFGLDVDGRVTFANPAAARMFGCEIADLVGQVSHPFFHHSRPDGSPYPQEDCPIYAAFRHGSTQRVDADVFWRRDGSSFPVEYVSTPIRDEEGGVAGAVVTFLDITERRRLEDQFRQSQKMEAIGRLAGGVAHDFNNLLTAIGGYTDLALRRVEPGQPIRRDLEEIRRAGERAAGLTRQLLAFSRRQMLQPKVIDLNELLANLEKMLRRLIGEDIDLAIAFAPNLGAVKADSGQIEQVVMNLAVNARDAMPRGGRITIETANVSLDAAYALRRVVVKPGPYVMAAVTDTGTGMDAETQSHLFEPFFTTKPQGRGTGLGLSTVYGIVKQSGGYIWAYSEPGKGSTFKVYLPRVNEEVQTDALPPPAAVPSSGSETVLLAEDEPGVRGLVVEILRSQGYSVIAAPDGAEALALLRTHAGRIDLLLTDTVMPVMGGIELAARALREKPGLRVLYMSGYTDNEVFRSGIFPHGSAFLQKPFTPEGLLKKVREVVEQT